VSSCVEALADFGGIENATVAQCVGRATVALLSVVQHRALLVSQPFDKLALVLGDLSCEKQAKVKEAAVEALCLLEAHFAEDETVRGDETVWVIAQSCVFRSHAHVFVWPVQIMASGS
jgi:hypothetical protein